MIRGTVVPVLVIGLIAGAGWHYREPLKQQWDKAAALSSSQDKQVAADPAVSGRPTARQDTIYRWVDEKGGIHYEQEQVAGSEAVVVDQSRIQSLDRYGKPAIDDKGAAVVEANGDAPNRSLRAVDRFPQAQAAPL